MKATILLASVALCACSAEPQPGNAGTVETNTALVVRNEAIIIAPKASPTPPSALASVTEAAPEATSAFNEQQLAAYPKARGLPGDVQHFIANYEECEHWAGEEPYDAERRNEIAAAVEETCRGIDAKLHDLTNRYRSSPDVAAALASYEKVGL